MSMSLAPAFVVLTSLLTLAACARAEGDWPSLLTPAEQARAAQGGATAAPAEAANTRLTPVASPMQGPAEDTGALTDVQLAQLRRDFAAAQARWGRQDDLLQAAMAQAGTSGAPDWSAAQITLSRLNDVATVFDRLESQTNALAGEVARSAAGGVPAGSLLSDIGRLLRRIDAAQATHLERVAAATDRLNPQ